MKKTCSVILFVLMSFSLQAIEHEVGIVKILNPINAQDKNYMILADDGQVFDLPVEHKMDLKLLKMAQKDRIRVSLDLGELAEVENLFDKRNEIKKVTLASIEKVIVTKTIKASPAFGRIKNKNNNSDLMNDYIINLDSYEDANYFYNTMRRDSKRRSQCYNRAHMWAWELYLQNYKGQRAQPGKFWLFYSYDFQRRYSSKWWFHVAPSVYIKGKFAVLDRSFLRRPEYENDWLNHFITKYTRRPNGCIEVTSYSEYERLNNQARALCFTMKSSVHYWQPYHLENLDKRGEVQFGWDRSVVRAAYKQALGGWFSGPIEIPGIDY